VRDCFGRDDTAKAGGVEPAMKSGSKTPVFGRAHTAVLILSGRC
jgi:hypothetical protein